MEAEDGNLRGVLGMKMGVRAEDLGYRHSPEADKTKGSLFTSSNLHPRRPNAYEKSLWEKTGGYSCYLISLFNEIGYRMQLHSDLDVFAMTYCSMTFAHDLCP